MKLSNCKNPLFRNLHNDVGLTKIEGIQLINKGRNDDYTDEISLKNQIKVKYLKGRASVWVRNHMMYASEFNKCFDCTDKKDTLQLWTDIYK